MVVSNAGRFQLADYMKIKLPCFLGTEVPKDVPVLVIRLNSRLAGPMWTGDLGWSGPLAHARNDPHPRASIKRGASADPCQLLSAAGVPWGKMSISIRRDKPRIHRALPPGIMGILYYTMPYYIVLCRL
jgi:hypothetical protein